MVLEKIVERCFNIMDFTRIFISIRIFAISSNLPLKKLNLKRDKKNLILEKIEMKWKKEKNVLKDARNGRKRRYKKVETTRCCKHEPYINIHILYIF